MRKGKKIKDKVSIKNTFLNITFMVKYLFGVNKSLFLIRIPLLILDTLSAVVSMLLLRALLNELTGNCDIKIAILFACLLYTSVCRQLRLSKLACNCSSNDGRTIFVSHIVLDYKYRTETALF